MEIVLNIAWAVCSLVLILLWIRGSQSNPVARRNQLLALGMVVLLLLPVISLSDDLRAMQGPAETDTCLRRALHSGDLHPAVAGACWALPAPIVSGLAAGGLYLVSLPGDRRILRSNALPRSLDSRPPPQA